MAWLIAIHLFLFAVAVLWFFDWAGCVDFWREVRQKPDIVLRFFRDGKNGGSIFLTMPPEGRRLASPSGSRVDCRLAAVVFGGASGHRRSRKRFLSRIGGEV